MFINCMFTIIWYVYKLYVYNYLVCLQTEVRETISSVGRTVVTQSSETYFLQSTPACNCTVLLTLLEDNATR